MVAGAALAYGMAVWVDRLMHTEKLGGMPIA